MTHGESGALADSSLAMHFDGEAGSRVEIPATSALELGSRFVVSSTSPTITRLFEITGLAGLLTE